MSMADYQKDPAPAPSLSAGVAHILNTQSPKHAWFAHPRLNPHYQREEDSQFDLGACAHAVLLEGEQSICAIDPMQYPGKKGGIPDGWTNQAIRDARDFARSQGKIPVLASKLTEIRLMAEAARDALRSVQGIEPIDLAQGDAEQVMLWQEGAVWCRARPDWRRKDRKLILDYKSTAGSAEPSAWVRNQMKPMGFDVQAVHYLRGNRAISGPSYIADWLFLVQENYPPYECSFVTLSNSDLEIAQRKWDYAFAVWERCMETNRWNGYPRAIAHSEPLAWEIDQDETRRLTFDERLELATQA